MSQKEIQRVLKLYKTVAIVGLSRSAAKPSYQVAEYLQNQGYLIIPVNPAVDKILGQKVFKSLLDIPPVTQKTIEIVDIFRPSKDVPFIVEQAIQLKKQHGTPHVIWMQLGITSQKAAEEAKKAGLTVIMDKCIMREHTRMFGKKGSDELEGIRAKKREKLKEKVEKGEKIFGPLTVTDANFDEIIKKHRLTVIDCWAAWCAPCRIMTPIIDDLANQYAGEVVFGKLNVDENPEVSTRYTVMGIPTLLVFKNGTEVDRIVGAVPKPSIESKLKEYF